MDLAVITGTNRGLGLSLTTDLRIKGWRVAEISRPRFDMERLDLAEVSKFLADFGSPSRAILIHNACDMQIAPANKVGPLAARSVQINVISAIELTSEFLNAFPAGEVALISSGAAKRGIAGWSLYCAAKAAMEGFLRALDAEGVKTYCIDPGVIDTQMQMLIRGSEFPLVEVFRDLHSSGALKTSDAAAADVLLPMAIN